MERRRVGWSGNVDGICKFQLPVACPWAGESYCLQPFCDGVLSHGMRMDVLRNRYKLGLGQMEIGWSGLTEPDPVQCLLIRD